MSSRRPRPGWVAYGPPKPHRWYALKGTGWRVLHCGHPTALRPYYVEDPEGQMHLNPRTGLAFTYLVDAQQRAEELAAARPPRRLVIVACGAQKAATKQPACHLYTGPYFRACFQYACSLGSWRDVRILSAKHGLVFPLEELEPYDVRLGDPDAITADELRRQAELGDWLQLSQPVVVVGGADYRNLVAQVWLEVGIINPLAAAGRGIGKQLAWLKANTPRTELVT